MDEPQINNIYKHKNLLKGYIRRIALQTLTIFIRRCPEDTGALRDNIRLEFSDNGWSIFIDKEYMVYTNEPWYSDRWQGAVNPNMYWWNEAFEEAFEYARGKLGDITERLDEPLQVGSEDVAEYQRKMGYID